MLHNTLQTKPTQMAPEERGTKVSLFVSSFFLARRLVSPWVGSCMKELVRLPFLDLSVAESPLALGALQPPEEALS